MIIENDFDFAEMVALYNVYIQTLRLGEGLANSLTPNT